MSSKRSSPTGAAVGLAQRPAAGPFAKLPSEFAPRSATLPNCAFTPSAYGLKSMSDRRGCCCQAYMAMLSGAVGPDRARRVSQRGPGPFKGGCASSVVFGKYGLVFAPAFDQQVEQGALVVRAAPFSIAVFRKQ